MNRAIFLVGGQIKRLVRKQQLNKRHEINTRMLKRLFLRIYGALANYA